MASYATISTGWLVNWWLNFHKRLKPERLYVKTQAVCGGAEGLVKPSAKPSPSTSVGLWLHMGQRLLRTCDALIQMMRFQRRPEEMGRAPCLCCPRWRMPSVTLCSTSEHSVSPKGTCRGPEDHYLNFLYGLAFVWKL